MVMNAFCGEPFLSLIVTKRPLLNYQQISFKSIFYFLRCGGEFRGKLTGHFLLDALRSRVH